MFADTNVLVYAIDDSDEAKYRRAWHVLTTHRDELVISTQVLVELHSTATRKLQLDPQMVADTVRDFARLKVVTTDARAVLDSIEIADRTGLSTYDALIVEAAGRGGCEMLLTEDAELLAADLGIETENPFA